MIYHNYHKHDHKGNIRALDVVVKLRDYCERAVELGHTTIFTTNHGMQGDIFEATVLAQEYGLKLIVGAECYYVKNRFEKDRSNRHIVVIALNDEGVRQLNEMISISNVDGYYYKPRIDYVMLMGLNPKNFVITTACVLGILKDEELVLKLHDKFKSNFFVEVQNHNVDKQKYWNKLALEYNRRYGIGLIHANDSHYIYKEDKKYRDLFLKAKDMIYSDEGEFILDYPSYEEIVERYKKQGVLTNAQISEALENTHVFDKAEPITIINKDIKLPSMSKNPNYDLKKVVFDAWQKEKKNIAPERIKEYEEAIRYEMDIIERTHMEDYFLLDYKVVERGIKEYGGMLTKTGRGCFTADSLVHTNNGLKSIKDVQIGDKVITKDGKFEKVYNTMEYDIEEEMIQIKHLYGTDKYYPTICTLDHKILVNRNDNLEWVEAKDLTNKDYVCVPKVTTEDLFPKIIDLNKFNKFGFEYDDDYIYEISNGVKYPYSPSEVAKAIGVGKSIVEDFSKINCNKKLFSRKPDKLKELMDYIPFDTREEYCEYVKNQRTKKINRYLDVDYEFNKFIGLMYGDGFTGSELNRVGLAINTNNHKNEINRDCFIKIANRLELDVYENRSKSRNLTQLFINSKVFATFISEELFVSKFKKEKEFNNKLFNQSKSNLEGLLKGLTLSDGSEDMNEDRVSFDNTSKSLINAYKILYLITGKGVNSLSFRKPHIDNRGYNCKESYKLRFNPNSNNAIKKTERTKEDESYWYLPVKEVIRLPKMKTKVYDISVENEHSYLLNNMIVHNSAPSFYTTKLLGLTDIDRLESPITLFPTRFMSAERILLARSLPDIDLNTIDREPFIKATEDLLGKENCAWLVSWKPLQKSSAFRLWCKANDMNINEYNDIAKDIDNYVDNPQWKDIIEESKHFVGVVESISESPCSMLVYDKNVSKEVGLVKCGDKICCLLDGYHCDFFKYLKNDLLTVTVWKSIREVCDLANIEVPSIKEFNNLLDDKTFDIYRQGLTCTINQADSDWATPIIKKYSPRNLAEMSAFVAGIRPGFASLLNNFVDRKPYSTNVKELDDLLEDSYHYLLYQESIMKYLIWLGIEEKETYDIIKKISKKKFKEKELQELKDKLKKGWLNVVGKDEGFDETWKVVEDASRYSFNASHSLSYAYDSLYGAYLKAHYPMEYYTVVLNEFFDDERKTKILTNELNHFGITLKKPQFRYSKSVYVMDKETNSIYKGIKSYKYLNEIVGEELYELRNNKYNNFIELLYDLKNTSINSRQMNVLIKLDFFREFGKTKYLLEVYNVFDSLYGKKQFSINKLPCGLTAEEISRYSNKATEKQFKEIDIKGLMNYCASKIKNEDLSIEEIFKTMKEYQGYIDYIDKTWDVQVYVVTEIKTTKYSIFAELYNLNQGEITSIKVDKKRFNYAPLNEYDTIYAITEVREKKQKVEGKWVGTGEYQEILTNWRVVV